MSSNKDQKLLKEYIRQILNEDGEHLSPGGEGSPYGMSWGTTSDLVSTFITPFTDVFKTAVGQSKEITRKARTVITLGFGTLISTFVPFMGSNYQKIFEKEKEDIEKIRADYKDVYDRTDKVLSGNEGAFLAFVVAPAATIAYLATKESPKVIKDILSVVTGGLSDKVYGHVKDSAITANKWAGKEQTSTTSTRVNNIYRDIKNINSKDDSSSDKTSLSNVASNVTSGVKDVAASVASELIESLIYENNDDKDKEESKKIKPKDILKNKTFIKQTLSLSPKSADMKKAASKIYKSTLQNVFSEVEKVLKHTNTIDDLVKISKKNVPEADQIRKLPPEEKKKAEKMLIDGIRKSMKDFYIKNLTDHLNGVITAGIPESSPYVKDYRETIQKIKSL